jgi:hypothetical protein
VASVMEIVAEMMLAKLAMLLEVDVAILVAILH